MQFTSFTSIIFNSFTDIYRIPGEHFRLALNLVRSLHLYRCLSERKCFSQLHHFHMEAGEQGFCLTESKNESPGQRRASKAIEFLLSRDTEKALKREKGPTRVANEGFSLAFFYLE